MKNLMKLAMGAAIAGALVNMLVKRQRARGEFGSDQPWPEDEWRESDTLADGESVTAVELIADESSVGEGSGDDRVLLPDDGVLRNTLNS